MGCFASRYEFFSRKRVRLSPTSRLISSRKTLNFYDEEACSLPNSHGFLPLDRMQCFKFKPWRTVKVLDRFLWNVGINSAKENVFPTTTSLDLCLLQIIQSHCTDYRHQSRFGVHQNSGLLSCPSGS